MNCIIVDNDLVSRKIIEQMVIKSQMLDLRDLFSDFAEVTNYLEYNCPDLIFIDFEMLDLHALKFLRDMSDPPLIVFTGCNKNYVSDPGCPFIIDYLLKPIDYSKFLKSLLKVKEAFSGDNNRIGQWEFILLNSKGVFIKTFYKDIVYVEAIDHYINIHTTGKKISSNTTMKIFADKLPPGFLRIHRSFVINTSYLSSIQDDSVSLKGGNIIPIGASYKKEVHKKINSNVNLKDFSLNG